MTVRLITQTNTGGSARLALNWLSSIHRLHIAERAHIYCTDATALDQVERYCREERITAGCSRARLTQPDDSVPPGEHPFGTRTFIKFTLWKLDLLIRLSVAQSDMVFKPFLFCDPDVVLLRDPESWLRGERLSWPGNWLIFQSDRPDCAPPKSADAEYSTGVIYQLAPTLEFWCSAYKWLQCRMPTTTGIEGPNFVHDQTAANAILEVFGTIPGYMSPVHSRNGAQSWDGDPVLVHSNWVIGNDTKEARLRDAGYWFANDKTLTEVGL